MTTRRHQPLLLFGFALVILSVLTLYVWHFHGRTYRQDEAWVVHHAMLLIEREGLLPHLLSVFTRIQPENFVLDTWVAFFGHAEPVTRYLSLLYIALTFATLGRLARDLYGGATALLAVMVLASLNLFAFYALETRPYAALSFGTVMFSLSFWRHARTGRPFYAGLMVVVAVIALYQHSFMLYVIAAHGLFYLLFARWRTRHYAQTFGALLVIGLLYGPRFLAVSNAANYSGGILYALGVDAYSLRTLYEQMRLRPDAIGALLLASAALMPFHKGRGTLWRARWAPWAYPLLVSVTLFALAFGVNAFLPNLTPRNLIIVTPFLALLAALGLRQMPLQARLVALVLIAIPLLTDFRSLMSNAAYDEVAAAVATVHEPQRGHVAILAGEVWEHVPLIYYLRERTALHLRNADLFHILGGPRSHYATMPDPPQNVVWDGSAESYAAFEAFMGQRRQLTLILGNPWPDSPDFMQRLEADYVPLNVAAFDLPTAYRALEVRHYRRIPDDLGERARFDNGITLQSWRLLNDVQVQPCQTVTLESWWRAELPPPNNDSLTLVLAGDEGGIAQNDGPPAGTLTGLWASERLYVDERAVTVPCDAAPGAYNLLVGYYDNASLASRGPLHYLTTLSVSE